MSSLLTRKPLLESSLDRLEREANDDFALLEEYGPAPFDTAHLQELLAQIRQRQEQFERRQRLAVVLGGTAAGWIFLGFLCANFGWKMVALGSLGRALLCLGGFFVLIFIQKKRFDSRGELEGTCREIEGELRLRQRATARF